MKMKMKKVKFEIKYFFELTVARSDTTTRPLALYLDYKIRTATRETPHPDS
jgi:hypothetical protein